MRCPNCRAWLAADPRAEDGSLVEAVLVAAPGQSIQPPPARRRPRTALALLLVVALAVLGVGVFAAVRALTAPASVR